MIIGDGGTDRPQSEIVVFYENFSEAASIFQSCQRQVEDARSQFNAKANNQGQNMGSTKLAEQYDSGVSNALTMMNNLAEAMGAYSTVFGQISALYERTDSGAI